MLCSECKKQSANVHFTGSINGKSAKLDLCEDCFRHYNAQFGAPLADIFGNSSFDIPTLSPLFSDLLSVLAKWPKASQNPPSPCCPYCRWTLSQFQKTGRMGCPECYRHFQGIIGGVVRKIHGEAGYKGKKLASSASPSSDPDASESISDLKAKLSRAINEEKYELAARLRDKIKELESRP